MLKYSVIAITIFLILFSCSKDSTAEVDIPDLFTTKIDEGTNNNNDVTIESEASTIEPSDVIIEENNVELNGDSQNVVEFNNEQIDLLDSIRKALLEDDYEIAKEITTSYFENWSADKYSISELVSLFYELNSLWVLTDWLVLDLSKKEYNSSMMFQNDAWEMYFASDFDACNQILQKNLVQMFEHPFYFYQLGNLNQSDLEKLLSLLIEYRSTLTPEDSYYFIDINKKKIEHYLEESVEVDIISAEDLIGVWHDMPYAAAGYSCRLIFEDDYSFVWYNSQMDRFGRMREISGSWKISGNHVVLTMETYVHYSNSMDTVEMTDNPMIAILPVKEFGVWKYDPEAENSMSYPKLIIEGIEYYKSEGFR